MFFISGTPAVRTETRRDVLIQGVPISPVRRDWTITGALEFSLCRLTYIHKEGEKFSLPLSRTSLFPIIVTRFYGTRGGGGNEAYRTHVGLRCIISYTATNGVRLILKTEWHNILISIGDIEIWRAPSNSQSRTDPSMDINWQLYGGRGIYEAISIVAGLLSQRTNRMRNRITY